MGYQDQPGVKVPDIGMLRRQLSEQQDVPKWREQEGVIYFSVESDGKTGEEWITCLEQKGFRIGNYGNRVLRSKDFQSTSGVKTEIAIIKGMLFKDNYRINREIRVLATECKFEAPNAEAACLIREMFTDEEIKAIGLQWIVVMHEPIKDSDGDPVLFSVHCFGGGRWFDTYFDAPNSEWGRQCGFAFAVSQQEVSA